MDPREQERINQKQDPGENVDVRRPEIEPDRREGVEVEKPDRTANPPHTDSGRFSAPKFGSAGSGGAEYEGNLPKD